MAGSLNKVMLIGNLGADPESKSFDNGGEVVNLRVATSETWKDKQGERQERTQWHQITIWNEPLGKFAKSYLRKGSKVFIEGQLETRKWTDRDGNDRYSTEVVLRPFNSSLTSLDKRERDDSDQSGGHRSRDDSDQTRKPEPATRGGFGGAAAFDSELDDDVPFITMDDRLEGRCT